MPKNIYLEIGDNYSCPKRQIVFKYKLQSYNIASSGI